MYLKVNWFFAMEHHFELSFMLLSLKNVIIRAREHHGKSNVLKVQGVVPQGPDQQKGVTSLPDSLLPVSPLHYREACPSLETHLKNSVTPCSKNLNVAVTLVSYFFPCHVHVL